MEANRKLKTHLCTSQHSLLQFWECTKPYNNSKQMYENRTFSGKSIIRSFFLKTCWGVREKGLPPIVNVTFGMFWMLLQSMIDSPAGLGKLSQSLFRSSNTFSLVSFCFSRVSTQTTAISQTLHKTDDPSCSTTDLTPVLHSSRSKFMLILFYMVLLLWRDSLHTVFQKHRDRSLYTQD